MSETKFKVKVLRELHKELEDAWIYKCSDRFTSGIPDILLLYRGVFAAIELKFGKNKASKLQVIVLSRIAKAGGITWICTDTGDGTGLAEIRAVIQAIKMRANGGNNEGHA